MGFLGLDWSGLTDVEAWKDIGGAAARGMAEGMLTGDPLGGLAMGAYEGYKAGQELNKRRSEGQAGPGYGTEWASVTDLEDPVDITRARKRLGLASKSELKALEDYQKGRSLYTQEELDEPSKDFKPPTAEELRKEDLRSRGIAVKSARLAGGFKGPGSAIVVRSAVLRPGVTNEDLRAITVDGVRYRHQLDPVSQHRPGDVVVYNTTGALVDEMLEQKREFRELEAKEKQKRERETKRRRYNEMQTAYGIQSPRQRALVEKAKELLRLEKEDEAKDKEKMEDAAEMQAARNRGEIEDGLEDEDDDEKGKRAAADWADSKFEPVEAPHVSDDEDDDEVSDDKS